MRFAIEHPDSGYLRIRTDQASKAKQLAGYWTRDPAEATLFVRGDADSLASVGWGRVVPDPSPASPPTGGGT